jgi:hypothetical protein
MKINFTPTDALRLQLLAFGLRLSAFNARLSPIRQKAKSQKPKAI